MAFIFNLVSTAASIYTLLCFVRILLTWFPSVSYSSFARFLANVCDPYLNIFRKIAFLRINYVDFSPAVAIIVMSGVSSIARSFAAGQIVTVGRILAAVVSVCGAIVSSILVFLILLVIIRLIVQIFAPHSTFQLWYSLDRMLHPWFDRVSGIFGGKQSWTASLVFGLISLIVVNAAFRFILNLLTGVLTHLPF
jgi:YggT family protein